MTNPNKPHKRGSPTKWIHTPTVSVRIPKAYSDLIMLVAIALDRLAISEKDVETLIDSKLENKED